MNSCFSCQVFLFEFLPSDLTDLLLGIINPIEAKQRKGKGAVGAYGSERTSQSLQDFPVVDSEEEAEEVFVWFLVHLFTLLCCANKIQFWYQLLC